MYWKNQAGLALPMVLIIMMIVMVLGVALMQYSTQSINHASLEEKNIQAHYLARSGAQLMLDNLSSFESMPDNEADAWEYNSENDPGNTAFLNELNGNSFSLKIYRLDSTTVIESTGRVGQITEKLIVHQDDEGQVYWEKNHD